MNRGNRFVKFNILMVCLIVLASCGGGGGSSSGLPSGNDPVIPGGTGTNPPPSGTIISQGTNTMPVDLGTAPLTYTNGSVAYASNSYYQFKTGQAGSYIVKLTNANLKMVWDLYAQKSDFTSLSATSLAYGNDIWTSITDLIDTAPNLDANTTYYLEVDNGNTNGNGGTYTISVVNGSSEGSKNTPLTLTADGSGHPGGIDTYGYSYYSFTSAGGSYVISIAGVSVPESILSWRVYSDSAFSSEMTGVNCNDSYSSGTPGAISCAAPNLPAGTHYLQVYNYGAKDTSYTITVAPDSSGSYIIAPMQLAIETNYDQTISDNGHDYYYFVVPMGGSGSYKMDLLSTNADMKWELYSDSAYSNSLQQCNTTSSPGLESCMTINNLDHGTYYIKVDTINTPPGPNSYPYSVKVTTQGCSEGSENEPVVLAPRVSYAGARVSQYNLIRSYYTFTTESLPVSVPYLVKMTSQNPTTQWLDSTIFTDKALTNAVGFCKYGPVNGETLCITDPLQGVSPVKLAPNTAYYMVISNEFASTPQPVTFTLQVVPFDSSTGCTTGGTDCFTFESGAADPRALSSTGSNGTGLWTRMTTTSGSGTQSLTSGISNANQDSSCVQFTASDVKWISFSFKAPFVSTSETLHFYIDSSQVEFWYNPRPWQRVIYAGAAGTHVYQWCYEKPYYKDTYDNVFLDDIELNY